MLKKPVVYRLFFISILIIIWELAAHFGPYPDALFPSLVAVVKRLGMLVMEEALLLKALNSISIVLIGMIISALIALTLSLLGIYLPFIKENTKLLNSVASPLPGIALLPIVILWLGLTSKAMMLIMVHAMLWPMVTTLTLALERVHFKYLRLIKVFKIPFWRRISTIYLPGIINDVFAGFEIAWSRGWRTLLSVEMIFGIVGSHSGLGWLIYERRMYMDTAGMLAGLIAIAVCGVLFESVLFKAKRWEVFIGTTDLH